MWALLQLSLRECSIFIKKYRIKKIHVFTFLVNIYIGFFENCWLFFNLFLSLEVFLKFSEICLCLQTTMSSLEMNWKLCYWSAHGVGEDPKPKLVKGVTKLGHSFTSLLGNFTQLSFSHWLFPHAISSHAY